MTILEVAQSQIGVEEIPRGSNWGEDVQKYLESVGIHFQASWCMAFVYWCAETAKCRISDGTGGLRNPLVKTGGVLKQWNEIEQQPFQPKCKILTDPQPGDIFIMDFGKGLGHTGIVEAVNGANISTIEGNTNDTGTREGYEVCRRTRSLKEIIGFIRIPQKAITA